MKQGIHPDYRPVVFQDASNGYAFLTRSTLTSDKSIKWEDGNEYPLISLEISSASHPFYTGTQRMVDTAGRVERFKQRYGRGTAKKASPKAAEAETPAAGVEESEGATPESAEDAAAPEADATEE